MSFSDLTMNNAIEAYGCNCDNCCMAWELEESLSKKVDIESLSARLPLDTADCQSLVLDYQAALDRLAVLEASNAVLISKLLAILELNHQQTDPYCPWCGAQDYPINDGEEYQCDHKPDCPVTLIEALLAYAGGRITRAELAAIVPEVNE